MADTVSATFFQRYFPMIYASLIKTQWRLNLLCLRASLLVYIRKHDNVNVSAYTPQHDAFPVAGCIDSIVYLYVFAMYSIELSTIVLFSILTTAWHSMYSCILVTMPSFYLLSYSIYLYHWQGILTPNNAGMFRSGVGRRRQQQQERRKQQPQQLSELSYNTTTDESEGDLDSGRKSGTGGVGGGGGEGSTYGKPSPLLPSHSVPPRRMTFSGYKADERSKVYKPQRRPSFLEKAGKRAVKVAVAATRATRRLSFYGNGEGAELVAIGVSPAIRLPSLQRISKKPTGNNV